MTCAPCLLLLTAGPLSAQLKPSAAWRTIRTEHFRVHFTPELEELARRAGANAESAYVALARELVPPRGTLDLVVADNVDYTNGSATIFPSNRIIVYASPPVDVASLRLYSDWNTLVVTHELAHVFHLDRSRGWWRVAQRVFGRSPFLFPNSYTPSWIAEGLAVYYETRLTGSGRLAGTYHAMVARAGVQGGSLLRLDELSLSTPRFPGGEVAYGYGALLLDFLSRTHGSEGVPRFVEQTSAQPIPFFYNAAARRSFGVTLERGWREWRDSLVRAQARAGGGDGVPLPGWRELTRAGRYALFPRWTANGDGVIYTASTGREVPGAYLLDTGRTADRGRRLGRRNGTDSPNVPLPDGGLLFTQLEFTDPFTLRGDLYVQRGRRQRALTRGARLSAPDARRSDGAVVAVQSVPSTTRLVRVSADGRDITPLTSASPDTQWTEPRWSPTGDRVAAVRWTRGGRADVVVLDSAGRVVAVVAGSGMVEAAPSWTPDGRTLLFSSDRTGTSQLYAVSLDSAGNGAGGLVPRRLSAAAAGIFQPAVSPDGRSVAASLFRADGFHIGTAPLDLAPAAEAPGGDSAVMVRHAPLMRPVARAESPAGRYRPWRSLLPRYWLPVASETDLINADGRNDLAFGAMTTGRDVIGRHAYSAQLAAPFNRFEEPEGGISYRYAGLGRPLLDVGGWQSWEHAPLTSGSPPAGWLSQREQTVTIAATLERPRIRTFGSLSLGGSRAWERFVRTEPEDLLKGLTFPRGRSLVTQGLFVSAAWSNTRRPELSISPEDGLSVASTVEQRWLTGYSSGDWQRVTGTARVYKALDLPGFAHHVLAARAAGGLVAGDATDDLDVGGTSGSSLELFPGYAIGSSSRRFGVRGFPAARQSGARAAAGSLEYRAPLLLPARGYRLLPLFINRTSLTAFGDMGSAWCSDAQGSLLICRDVANRPRWLQSVGAELNVDASIQYDFLYRFRFGVAKPLSGGGVSGGSSPVAYFTLGSSF